MKKCKYCPLFGHFKSEYGRCNLFKKFVHKEDECFRIKEVGIRKT